MADDTEVKERAPRKQKTQDEPVVERASIEAAPVIEIPKVENPMVLARKIGKAIHTTLTLPSDGRTFHGLKMEIPLADFEILRERGLVTEA